MYAEVQHYIEEVEAAAKGYQAVAEAVETVYNRSDKGYEARRARQAALLDERRKQREQENKAWEVLKGSSDPLVAWIAKNASDYRSEAAAVLRILPASVDELDAFAESEGWCDAWDRYREQMEDDGVLPGATQLSSARRELRRWTHEYGMGSHNRSTLLALVDKVVAEEAKA